jgi:hypothetical protein
VALPMAPSPTTIASGLRNVLTPDKLPDRRGGCISIGAVVESSRARTF